MKKKLFNALFALIICALAVLAFTVIVGRIQNKVVFIGNKAAILVLTNSMEDLIPEQSYILVEKINDAETEVQVGDVITFRSTDPAIYDRLNTHRVVEIDRENGKFVTKGDNNPYNDEYDVEYASVEGRYVRGMPALTVVGRFLMSPIGFILTMAVIMIAAGFAYLPDIIKVLHKEDQDSAEQTDRDKEIERRVAEEVERLKKQNENKN